MAKLGGRVDELELDLLEGIARGLGQERAAQRDGALDSTWDGSLNIGKGDRRYQGSSHVQCIAL